MVVAAVVPPLHHRRPAELAAPDDERVVQQAPLLQVRHQRGTGLVGVEAVLLDAGRQVAVLVPGFVEQLHEADAALDQPAGEQAVAGEVGILDRFDAVYVKRLRGFLAEVHELRGARLQRYAIS